MIPARPLLSQHEFGQLPDGRLVQAWRLGNEAGAFTQVITYGGIVTHLSVPDRAGELADVVLGFNSLAPYLLRHPYFGAVVGRVAGRITGGKFVLDGATYQLAINNPPNHLHGGRIGFDQRLWHAEPLTRPDGAAAVRLTLQSEDGEEGYPGRLEVAVTYTFTSHTELIFETEVRSDRPTPASLTNHSCFNLAGEGAAPVLAHEVQIRADTYAPVDASMTLLGQKKTVDGTACDFRRPRRLSEALDGLTGAHGAHYFFTQPTAGVRVPVTVARVRESGSGRVLQVSTTEDCMQFYTGSFLNGSFSGKSGAPYVRHQGMCLECEGYPDGVNVPALGDILVHPAHPRRHTTVYAFSTD